MKQINLVACLLLFALTQISAQVEEHANQDEALYIIHKIYTNIDNNNVDSAISNAQKLVSLNNGIPAFQNLIHSRLAGEFFGLLSADETKERLNTAHLILNTLIADSSEKPVQVVKPLFLTTSIMYNRNSEAELNKLVNQFINTQLKSGNLFDNKVSRYAFIIYNFLSHKETLKPLADNLLNTTIRVLEEQLKNVHLEESEEQAFWYKWMYACGNYFKAIGEMNKKNIEMADKYFRKACDFSVDKSTRECSVFYYRDMIFIFKKEVYFENDYFEFLANSKHNKEEALAILSKETLVNYKVKKNLALYYNEHFSHQKSFSMYWLNFLNQQTTYAPDFNLKEINGVKFTLSAQKGKWVLLDFWGTWCGPCREEHPALQKFYQNVSTTQSEKITLITVACKNNENEVKDYLQKNNYSFPVAMANTLIEKDYKVGGYPSKFLITPQGKFIEIPPDVDWVDYVTELADLKEIR